MTYSFDTFCKDCRTALKAADSYFAFRAVYKTWGDAQSLDSTYLK